MEWISVKDKVPVAIFSGTEFWFYNGIQVYRQRLTLMDSHFAQDKKWYEERNITHWMYFKKPDPPKEKK